MKCPFCGHENTRVIDSRPAEENNSIRRRRVCDECDKRFTTYEKIETIPLIVVKKDNNREAYDRTKIEAGVLRACHKRPISADQIKTLVDEVETEIFSMEEKEVPSRVIGELVMNKRLLPMSVLLPSIGNSRTLIPLWMSLKRYWNNNKEIESIVYLFLYTIDFFYLFV